MAITVTCECGESFAAPESLGGKKAKCPSCAGIIQIPAATPAATPAAPKSPATRSQPAKRSQAQPQRAKPQQARSQQAAAAGKQAAKSAQRQPQSTSNPVAKRAAQQAVQGGPASRQGAGQAPKHTIQKRTKPAAPAASSAAGMASNDVFEMDDLSALESGHANDPLGLNQPAPSQQGQPGPYGGAPTQPASPHGYAAPARSGGLPMGLILGVGGGLAALVLIVIVAVVVVVMMNRPGDEQVATNDDGSSSSSSGDTYTPSNNNPSGNPGYVGNSTTGTFGDGRVADSTSPTGGDHDAGFGTGDTTDDPARIEPVNPFARNDSDSSSGFGQSSNNATTTTSSGGRQSLRSAALKWHNDQGLKLSGLIRVEDEDVIVYHYSWMTSILPHIGEQSLYDTFDFEKNFLSGQNLRNSQRVVSQFLNPLDDFESLEDRRFPGFAVTHFAGMAGVETRRNDLAAEFPRDHPRAGIFGYDEVVRPKDISDGLSETIMIIGTGEFRLPWVCGGGATVRGARAPYFDSLTGFGSTGLDSPGVIAVMADGSVRHLSADIAPEVFSAMCTIQGAEEVDLSSSDIGPEQDDWFGR